VYPEVKKAKKLTSIIMKSVGSDFIPSEIKIPVLSSLGIKAIIKIGQTDYTPMSKEQAEEIFLKFDKDYLYLKMSQDEREESFVDRKEQPRQVLKSLGGQKGLIDKNIGGSVSNLSSTKSKSIEILKSNKIKLKRPKSRTSKIAPPHIFLTKM
jgi:hypothetical protein